MELELIEPDLFLRMAPGSVSRFADMVEARVAENPRSRNGNEMRTLP
jgi:hypothetical protein